MLFYIQEANVDDFHNVIMQNITSAAFTFSLLEELRLSIRNKNKSIKFCTFVRNVV